MNNETKADEPTTVDSLYSLYSPVAVAEDTVTKCRATKKSAQQAFKVVEHSF